MQNDEPEITPPTTPEIDGPRPAVGPDDNIPFEGEPNA